MVDQLSQSLLVISLVISFIFIIIGVGLIVLRMFSFTKDLLKLVEKDTNREAEQIKADALAEATKILDDARLTSVTTIRESNEAASKLLSEASKLSTDTKSALDTITNDLIKSHEAHLGAVSAQYLSEYEKLLKDKTESDLSSVSTTLGSLESGLTSQLDKFQHDLSASLNTLQNTISTSLMQKYENVDVDVENYRKMRLAKVDEHIYKILEEVSVRVLGKAVDAKGLEDFITDQLTEKISGIK